jgi:DNA-binding transcriptional regulator YdaS (Cro superfamily)
VNYILNAGKKVPAEWCLAIERATAEKCAELGEGEPVTRHDLRPDLYPRAEAAA